MTRFGFSSIVYIRVDIQSDKGTPEYKLNYCELARTIVKRAESKKNTV